MRIAPVQASSQVICGRPDDGDHDTCYIVSVQHIIYVCHLALSGPFSQAGARVYSDVNNTYAFDFGAFATKQVELKTWCLRSACIISCLTLRLTLLVYQVKEIRPSKAKLGVGCSNRKKTPLPTPHKKRIQALEKGGSGLFFSYPTPPTWNKRGQIRSMQMAHDNTTWRHRGLISRCKICPPCRQRTIYGRVIIAMALKQ